jgi:hypothetical protein
MHSFIAWNNTWEGRPIKDYPPPRELEREIVSPVIGNLFLLRAAASSHQWLPVFP